MYYLLFIIIIVLFIYYYRKYKKHEAFIDFIYPTKKKINLFYDDCIIPIKDKLVDDKPYYERSNQDLRNIIFNDKPIYNEYKTYNDKYYGITKTKSKIINEPIIHHKKFKNICQLSGWSNWSNCNTKYGDRDYNTQYRTRIILNKPDNCYSPTNPILKQKITCGNKPCFTPFTF